MSSTQHPGSSAHLSTTSFAVLGLLALREWTTYELAQQMERSFGHVWPRAERRIYDEPKRLVAAGLATSRARPQGRRNSTVYAITPAGRAELTAWLATPPMPASLEFEGLLRVLLADQGDLASLRASLQAVRDHADEARTRLAVMCVGSVEDDGGEFAARLHVNALGMQFLLDHHTHVAAWADWALAQVATWPSTDDGEMGWRDEARAVFARGAAMAPIGGVVRGPDR
jgi:DNA-binding PadR family transcriptional regulator